MSQPIKLEDKALVFEFRVAQAQFNKSGKYCLRIAVHNSHRSDLLPQVTIEQNNSGSPKPYSVITTDTVVWDGQSQSVGFEKNFFRYRFPKGFCKNDKNYDVNLSIEALAIGVTSQRKARNQPVLVGEATYAIYPRTDTPRANLNVARGENYYNYAGIITLLRPLTKSSISMHGGRLSYTVAFRESLAVTGRGKNLPDDDRHAEVNANEKPATKPETAPKKAKAERPEEPPEEPSPPPPEPKRKSTKPAQKAKPVQSPARKQSRKPTADEEKKSRSDETASLKEKLRSQAGRLKDASTQADLPPKTAYAENPVEEKEPDAISRIHIGDGSEDDDDLFPTTAREKTQDEPATPESQTTAIKRAAESLNRRRAEERRRGRKPAADHPPTMGEREVTRHVAKPGFENVVVLIHGATSLPSCLDGSDPTPFVTVKTSAQDDNKQTTKCATHATPRPTHSPTWEESLTLPIAEGVAGGEQIVMSVNDSVTKEQLVSYKLPVDHLQPFHPYHFELVQPTKAIPSGIRLYATIQRQLSHLNRLQGFGYCGLEVTVRDFQHELRTSVSGLIAVARIVPDYTLYKDKMLSHRPSPAGITPITITFPSPNPNLFGVPGSSPKEGFPQTSVPSTGDTRPSWQHSFLFSNNEAATMFSHNSALVIEYYLASSAITPITWAIRNPVGFSTLHLDDELFQALQAESGRLGVRVDDLAIQDSQFKTVDGSYPSVRLLLRLINTERPDSLATTGNLSMLPVLDSLPSAATQVAAADQLASRYLAQAHHYNQPPPPPSDERQAGGFSGVERKKTTFLVREDEFPPNDAIQSILPEYARTVNDSHIGNGPGPPVNSRPPPQHLPPPADQHVDNLLGHHERELYKYREATNRMSRDIVNLRRDNLDLQSQNQELLRELGLYRDVSDNVTGDIDAGLITTDDIGQRLIATNRKLQQESEDLRKYKSKVQNLQNEVIKSNEREKKHLMDEMTRNQLVDHVQHLEGRSKKTKLLEETCIRQEKVIQKMENLLKQYLRNAEHNPLPVPATNMMAAGGPGYRARPDERLFKKMEDETERLNRDLQQAKLREDELRNAGRDVETRLRLAENRVLSLESQLDKNTRDWAKEKHDLTVRLNERRNGIHRDDSTLGC